MAHASMAHASIFCVLRASMPIASMSHASKNTQKIHFSGFKLAQPCASTGSDASIDASIFCVVIFSDVVSSRCASIFFVAQRVLACFFLLASLASTLDASILDASTFF